MSHQERLPQQYQRSSGSLSEDERAPPPLYRRRPSDSSGADQPHPAGRSQPHGEPQHTNRDVESNGHVQEHLTLRSFLPSAWAVPKGNPYLRLKNPGRLKGRGGKEEHILVVTNKPIPMQILQRSSCGQRNELHPEMNGSQMEPLPTNKVNVYYFEVTIGSGVTWIGLVPEDQLQKQSVTPSRFPGDCSGSIGMASDGRLFVSSRLWEVSTQIECHAEERETLGCGLEISDHPKIFFTKNGQMLLPPMDIPDLDILQKWYFPAVGVAASGDIFANFGLSYPFRWKGSSQHQLFSPTVTVQVPSSPGHYPTRCEMQQLVGREESWTSASPSMDSSSTAFQVAMDASLAWRPSAVNSNALPSRSSANNSNARSQSETAAFLPLSPSANDSTVGPRSTSHGTAPSSRHPSGPTLTPLQDHRRTTIYGKPSDKAIRLEVDFPGPTSPSPSGAISSRVPPREQSPLTLPTGASMPVSSTSSSTSSERKLEASASLLRTDFFDGPPYPVASPISERPRQPSFGSSVSEKTRPGVVWEKKSSMPMNKQAIEDAKACAHDLRRCCESANADESFLQGLLETCRLKQTEVRRILEEGLMKFDDPTLEGMIHELVMVNEILVDSITMAEMHIEGEKKPPAVDTPPTYVSLEIDALVQTRDIFSLICMLRAQGDKRLESALALMRFARDAERSQSLEAEQLRHEICSSGGMDSLLTLFRTKGGTRELKVVVALAVAYLLPSFEQSNSLQSSSLGLKIIECLRFLFASMPITPQGEELRREEMCAASAKGVYTFWYIVLDPLLRSGLREDIAPVHSFSESPELVRGTSTRMRRRTASQQRVGGNVFDQRQEVLELQELLELTVSLIVEMAKTSDLAGTSIHTFVHAICAIDLARPIAVREGLLKVLVSWMRSNDVEKIRCAATSVNELTSTVDSYMAGWIHSQIVNEGALAELLSVCERVGQGVRLAVAEILCRLCVAPHTRAAVVEAQCIECLICLLYEFGDPESQKVAFAAGSALLQLVAGAMSRASVFSSDNDELNEAASPDKRDRVISDVIEGGAINQFVAMARLSSRGRLREMSIEALRVLSEDYHSSRRTRLQLCEGGAGGALGHAMKDTIEGCTAVMKNDHDHDGRLPPKNDEVVKELHQALRAWANILDYQAHTPGSSALLRQSTASLGGMNAEETLVKGCTQFVEEGGLTSLLAISALPFNRLSSQLFTEDVDVLASDLMVEACRSLASLSPLLLSSQATSQGYAVWSTLVLQALARILNSATDSDDADDSSLANELKFDALRGIGALAKYKPLKMIIVDKYLPSLFQAKMARCDSFDVSGAAEEVCLSLGFVEGELPQQVAGNDPKLMGDWLCMKRSLLIQSMARAEIRKILFAVWKEPLRDLLSTELAGQPSGLGRSSSRESTGSAGQRSKDLTGSAGEIRALEDIFEILSLDQEGSEIRNTITEQYHHVYEYEASIAGIESLSRAMRDWRPIEPQSKSLLSSHVYPLDSTSIEKEWILSHRRFMLENAGDNLSIDVSSSMISDRVQTLLDYCIPSRLIQQDVMPIFDLQPESSFDFRGFLMPQRRYFSFRREGQLMSRLCDMNALFLNSDEVHWTLGFTNSTFAGEFSESLVQALYRCPLIKGISFVKNANWRSIWSSESEDEGQDTSGLLANLVGSLPQWVSCVIYDNTLSDFALTSLVAILETMGKLSASQAQNIPSDLPSGDAKEAWLAAKKQGSFRSFAVRNSPHLSFAAWKGFFALLGKTPGRNILSRVPPLASLRVLDLSGNGLGDELCSFVLGRVLDRSSGCCLEQLDLSRNCICEGSRVVRVLRNYVKRHRFNQCAGVKVTKDNWKSPLISLNLSSNELNVDGGGLALEAIDLLKNNALNLKSLDLSNNGLESEGCQFTEVLLISLVKNTCLHHLNISGNRFGARCIDGLLDGLNHSVSDSSLAFLLLENNLPPLTESQRESLKSFVNESRKIMLQRYLRKRDRPKTEDEDSIDVETIGSESLGPFSFSDTASSNVDGTKHHPSLRRSPEGVKGENMITVLFSAPLVFHDDENKLRPFAKLDFDMERELLWQCLKEARRDIELFFDTAHHDRLLTANTKRCSCLHYSGHGHHTHLPFENGKGGAHWLEVNEIRDLIMRNEGAPFKFVFVSACFSGLVGETFASAGVPHVVCCQQQSELKDAAALAFTRQFYLSLAVGNTVKESFEQGCKAVRATPNLRNAEEEMKKFILLPKDGNHNVPVFDARPVREWPRTVSIFSSGSTRSLQRSNSRRGNRAGRGLIPSRSIYFGGARSSELSVRNMMQEDPSPTPPQFFTGREVDMYHVLNYVLTQKLVSVVGEKGIGRSSLVYGLCHYVNERRSTIILVQRIYFMRVVQNRGSDRFVAMLRGLLKKIMQDGRAPQQQDDHLDFESLIHAICIMLGNVKALLVIDHSEFLEGSAEAQDLIVFLTNLFRETRTKHVRVLLIGRHPLGIPSIFGVVEQPYRLGPLSFCNTVRLFGNLCPHLHTPAERKRFYNRLVTEEGQSDLLPSDSAASERTKKLFAALGNGVPSRTEKAAYTISSEDLSHLEQL